MNSERGLTHRALATLAMLVLGLGTALIGLVGTAGSANAVDKVGVCHRTASDTNPYVYISVPENQANGHITGTGKNHKKPRVWKSDGTWRGVAHSAGDPKIDYLAPNGAQDCEDSTGGGPDLCPEGTDKAGETIPEGEDASWCDEDSQEVDVCPAGTDKEGEEIPEGEDSSWCDEEEEQNLCPEGSDNAGQEVPEGEDPALFCDDEELGVEECPDGSPLPPSGDFRDCETSSGGGGGNSKGAEVLGVEAAAPAAAPTAVDAGLTAEQPPSSTGPWLLAGAALALMGAALGFAPARTRGKRVR